MCQWQAAYRSTGAPLAGATVVAEWGQGRPLVVRGTKAGRRIAALNMYPVSATMGSILWVGDGAALMRNALLYSSCIPCRVGAFADFGPASICFCCSPVTKIVILEDRYT